MYLYSFTRFGGFDKVFKLSAENLKTKTGDLLQLGSEFFLCLGEKVSFEELYGHVETLKNGSMERCYPGFLSKKSIELLHRMVATYYTTYKSVIKLFISDEVEKLLEREKKSGKLKKIEEDGGMSRNIEELGFSLAESGQTLIVFPDLRTMSNQQGNTETLGQGNIILLASNTQNQKDVHRWEIKKGLKSVIICTYAEIFQDFKDLKKIIFFDPHKRYYASQHDPRYKVGEVLKEMKKLHGAEMEIAGI
ncbi:MAG: hypothetical protein WC875_01615 [Candidatus Absconditabacterales bacterium]